MDNNLVKKIMTFKSGNFVFSSKYSASELDRLLLEAKLLYITIQDLPILPSWAVHLGEELIRRSIFSTAAIEGNPLKEEEVGKIIEQKDDPQKGRDEEARQAIINLKKAYDHVKNIKSQSDIYELTEDMIKDFHRIITDKLDYQDNLPGQYRDHKVQVGDQGHGGIYTPPKCKADIDKLMKGFIEWINCTAVTGLDALIRASLAHYHLGLIHPFGNGNGRTIRIIEALILKSAGVKFVPTMLSNYYYSHIDDYYRAFSFTRRNSEHDMTMFLKFMLEGVIDSLKEIKNTVTFSIRRLVMKDLLSSLKARKSITQRQYELLCLLLESGDTLTLKNLFNIGPYNALYRHVSERTARRDLSKLAEMKLLTHNNGDYNLNLKALG